MKKALDERPKDSLPVGSIFAQFGQLDMLSFVKYCELTTHQPTATVGEKSEALLPLWVPLKFLEVLLFDAPASAAQQGARGDGRQTPPNSERANDRTIVSHITLNMNQNPDAQVLS